MTDHPSPRDLSDKGGGRPVSPLIHKASRKFSAACRADHSDTSRRARTTIETFVLDMFYDLSPQIATR
jgi:hypothetical protein